MDNVREHFLLICKHPNPCPEWYYRIIIFAQMGFDNDSSMNTLLLASTSPRRQIMLAKFIPNLIIGAVPDFIESIPPFGDVSAIAQGLAHQKLQAVIADPLSDMIRFIVTADTLVAHGERILGKPLDLLNAKQMLLGHLGQSHTVVSAAWLFDRQTQTEYPLQETAQVYFRALSDETLAIIEHYLTLTPPQGPLDKAGAYGIQEPLIGDNLIERIDGSYEAIVGFPLKSFKVTWEQLVG